MKTFLIVLMVIIGIICVCSILLMSPKWGIWAALGWLAWSDEYGSKKSLEWKLKKIALIAAIVFLILVCILPYVD